MRRDIALPTYGTLIFWVSVLAVVFSVGRYNYNLFHSLADGASIIIAACVFTIIWNSRRLVDNNYFLYTGIAFLFFAFWDLLHLLGNKNMGVFPEYGNLGPTFYIVSRYTLSISLLIAPWFINRRLNTTLMFGAYSLATLIILLSIFYWRIFPACIVEGMGLTAFKVASDYIICCVLLGAIGLLLVHRRSFDPRVLRLIVSSILLSIATGLTFTLYTDPFGVTNALGHLLQIASFYLVYLAFIQTSLTEPEEILFRKLKQKEEKERRQNRILEGINRIFSEAITGRTEQELCEVCLEVVETLTESRIGFIGEIGPDGHLFDIAISNPGREACSMADPAAHGQTPGRFQIDGLYGRVLKDGKSLLSNAPADHPDSVGTPETHPPLTAFLGTPLIREGKTIGLIAVGNREGGYTPEQQQTLEILAPVVHQTLLKKRTESELQASETRYRAFFESAAVGTAELGPDGSFLHVNRRLCEITGYSADELVRMAPVDLSPPEDFQHNRDLMDAHVHGKMPLFDMERPCRRKDGSIVWLRTTAAIVRGENGEPSMSAAIFIDINERRQAEEALNQQSAKLEAANRELESFAYSVSHDLRAPLRAIDGFSRMLLFKTAGKLSDDEKRQFEVIRHSTQRMGQLIDDLLTFSRLGRQSMCFSDVDVTEIARHVWEELLTINPGRRISLTIGALPAAFGDAALITQVLANLLSNAVKFTRKKEEARVEIVGEARDSETVYCVRDNGAGFDMSYREKLFGVFQRLHGEDEFEGTGAGLAIVQRIIHRHGGRIWGEGEVGKGAAFYFTLPARRDVRQPDSPSMPLRSD